MLLIKQRIFIVLQAGILISLSIFHSVLVWYLNEAWNFETLFSTCDNDGAISYVVKLFRCRLDLIMSD